MNDFDQRQSTPDILASRGKRAQEMVKQENMQVVMDFNFLPLLQGSVLKYRPAVRGTERVDHSLGTRTRFSARERSLQLVGQLHVTARCRNSAIVVGCSGAPSRLCAFDLLNVVEHCGR